MTLVVASPAARASEPDPAHVERTPSLVKEIGGALLLVGGLTATTGYGVALFSGLTALDQAAQLDTLGGSTDEVGRSRTLGLLLLVPWVGPLAAPLFGPDLVTIALLLTAASAQVVGTVAAGTGAALWGYTALFEE